MIVFRDGVRSNAARLDPALRKAWASFATFTAAGARCRVGNGGGTMAEVGGGFTLANVFPPLLCQVTPPPVRRLRLSTWASAQVVTANTMTPAQGVLDDVSLLRTVTFSADAASGLVMDPGLRRPAVADRTAPNGSRAATLQEIVASARSRGIQVLAGFGIVTGAGSGLRAAELPAEQRRAMQFNDWLANPVSPTMAAFVNTLVGFVLTGTIGPAPATPPACPLFDGISIDVETLRNEPAVTRGFTALCRGLAARLAPRGIVAVAVGSKVSDTDAFAAGSGALAQTLAIEWRMAVGVPNLVIRPMGYDAGDAGIEAWHGRIVRYALGTVGLAPSQFQMGVKTVAGNGSMSRQRIEAECRTLLRPSGVGLIDFTLVGRQSPSPAPLPHTAFDAALNAGAPRPATVGEPLQVPLASLACFTSSDARLRFAAPRRALARARP
jgi:hypothetical protein